MESVSTSGYTYDFYKRWLTFPSIVLYILAFGLLLYLLFRLVWSICCGEFSKCDTFDVDDNRLPLKYFLYDLPKQIFKIYEERIVGVKEISVSGRKLLPMENDEDGSENRTLKVERVKEISVGGRKLLPVEKNADGSENRSLIYKVLAIMELLSINTISILVCAFVVSWNIFLVDQTYSCNPDLDCYALRGRSPVQQHPIVNCSDFESLDNVTIQCFRFTFRYGAGLAAFGGLLKFSESVLGIFVSISLWAVDSFMRKTKATDSCSVKFCINSCYIVAGFVLFFTVLSPLALLIIGPIYISIVYVQERSTFFRDIAYTVTAFLIAVYVVVLVCLAFILPKRKSFEPKIMLQETRYSINTAKKYRLPNSESCIESDSDYEDANEQINA